MYMCRLLEDNSNKSLGDIMVVDGSDGLRLLMIDAECSAGHFISTVVVLDLNPCTVTENYIAYRSNTDVQETNRVKQAQLLTVTVNSFKHFNLFTTKHSSPTFNNIMYILFIIIIIFTIIIFTIFINTEFKLQFRKIHNFILH
ncbi:hypothetical protein Q8A73_000237 [Channa argus]|nr:hypothetical protein Q8A73_000237 [Channa argus]